MLDDEEKLGKMIKMSEKNLCVLLIELNCTSIEHKYSSCAITLSFIFYNEAFYSLLTEWIQHFFFRFFYYILPTREKLNSTQLETTEHSYMKKRKRREKKWNLLFVFPLRCVVCKKLLHLQKNIFAESEQNRTEHRKKLFAKQIYKIDFASHRQTKISSALSRIKTNNK